MDARIAANFLLYIMSDSFDDLTNMKINKLLFYAQGHYLAKYGKPLFYNKIEAWEHGPVIPDVYSTYKRYGDGPITEYDIAMTTDVKPEEEDILYNVARKYGRYTASALRNMTHVVGSPWEQVYRKNNAHIEITRPLIQGYFEDLGELTRTTKQFKEDDFIGYRDENGTLVLPKDWDDEEI